MSIAIIINQKKKLNIIIPSPLLMI